MTPAMTRTAALVAAIALVFLLSPLSAQDRSSTPRQPTVTVGDVHVLPVKGNVYMVAGAGGNIALQIGEDGVLLVDTGLARTADQVLAAVRQLTNKPIRWILNTHAHIDHTGGNEAIASAGSGLVQNNARAERNARVATIVAHDNVLRRINTPSGNEPARPSIAWPEMTFLEASREMYFNDELVLITHQPAAHTDGDSTVFFRRSDVVVAGDAYSNASYPVIDISTGGTINGTLEALNHLLDVMVSKEKTEGGTYVIPGHGRLADEADVFAYRNMATIIRDRIQDLKQKGMSLDQIKAARPTLDYDARYATPSLTGDMFIETVYRTLPDQRTPARATARQGR